MADQLAIEIFVDDRRASTTLAKFKAEAAKPIPIKATVAQSFFDNLSAVERRTLSIRNELRSVANVTVGRAGLDGLGQAALRTQTYVTGIYTRLQQIEKEAATVREPAMLNKLAARSALRFSGLYSTCRKSFLPRLAARCAEKLCFSGSTQTILSGSAAVLPMFQISRKTPAYYLTSVAHHRLPVFQTDALKRIVCNAFNAARISGGIMILAYVIMADHLHLITNSHRSASDALRFLNGVSARRVLNYLKENGHETSLRKLQIQEREQKHKYSLYEHHPNSFEIYGEDTLMQKVNYVHVNPVRAGLVEHPDDYLYSSARQWHGKALENEPLITDHKKIRWWAA